MREFENYHPMVNFIYFVLVIGFSMFLMHPVCVVISGVGGFLYSVMLGKKQALKMNILYVLPMVVFMALLNPVINRAGETVLFAITKSFYITKEALVFGAITAMMAGSVIFWFSAMNKIMTSDKYIYIFGRVAPTFALVFSMTLRFIPKFFCELKQVIAAQRGIGNDISDGKILCRIKTASSVMSIMTTWAIERAVQTADSMKCRGFGIKKRTSYSNYRFGMRDVVALLLMAVAAVCIIVGAVGGALDFTCYPQITAAGFTWVYVAHFILCFMPVVTEICEVIKWRF